MREIKFRAWCGETKQYFIDPLNVLGCLQNQAMGLYNHQSHGMVFEQFTGLLDKDGVEIYQGDKLSLNYGIPPTIARFVVEWVDDYEVFEHDCCSYFACGWVMRSIGVEPSAMLTTHYLQDITIIGNIHDEATP
jgi:hypothetical protein